MIHSLDEFQDINLFVWSTVQKCGKWENKKWPYTEKENKNKNKFTGCTLREGALFFFMYSSLSRFKILFYELVISVHEIEPEYMSHPYFCAIINCSNGKIGSIKRH